MSNGVKKLKEIIQNNTFIIPLYQRNYKWGVEETDKLMDDFIKIYKEGNEKTKSLGLLTLYFDEKNKCVVIDGQQRLITLQIIFSVLGKTNVINLIFERDYENDKPRSQTLYNVNYKYESTDADRIRRNREKIKDKLENIKDKDAFCNFLLNNCTMLCSYINSQPIDEFMNLNAYKTKFSICDHVRANMISLNSFYRDELEKKNAYLADALDQYSYKSAIAHLYTDILKLLYEEDSDKNQFFSCVLGKNKNPEDIKESRINFLFKKVNNQDNNGNYFSDIINENLDYWIRMILKLACVKRVLNQLKEEWSRGELNSLRKIDDYQQLKEKNFLRSNIMEIDKGYKEINALTLAQMLKEKSNVVSILLSDLDSITDQRLANRYLESFINSVTSPKEYIGTNTSIEKYIFEQEQEKEKENEVVHLYTMPKKEVLEEIQGIGRNMINRYVIESRRRTNTKISIAPLMNLEDTENVNFGGELELDNEISVGELFGYNIKIPVIQRDYCMGYQINDNKEDFLQFLLNGFNKDKDVIASTIVIAIENNKEQETNNIYIFDGQQRTYTLYIILEYLYEKKCKNNDLKKYEFIGRDNTKNGKSPYSDRAEKNLKRTLGTRLKEISCYEELADYLKKKVKFKVQVVKDISSAEQFFMDINGGVELEKYEIFKSILYKRLIDLKQIKIIKKIENEWLLAFYNWKNTVIKKGGEKNEKDEEELLEMRFIEYVCRFIYNNEHEEKWSSEDVFDVFTSKSELVAREGQYIKKLNGDDIAQFVKVMDAVESDIKAINNNIKELENIKQIQLSLEGSHTYIEQDGIVFISSDQTKRIRLARFSLGKDSQIESVAILHSFIWSLYENNRAILKKIYGEKEFVKNIIKIYDDDNILKLYIKEKIYKCDEEKQKLYEDYITNDSIKIHIIGGYNIGLMKVKYMSRKELPFYYAWEKIEKWGNKTIIRFNFENSKEENKKTYCFALVADYPGKKNISMMYIGTTSEDMFQKDSDLLWKICIENETRSIELVNKRDAFVFQGSKSKRKLEKWHKEATREGIYFIE